MCDVIKAFGRQIELCRVHLNEASWLNLTRKIDLFTLADDVVLICTDFSASLDLRAKLTDNCSQDNHAVLAIYYVQQNRREIHCVDKDGTTIKKVVFDTQVFFFFGDSQSKGKKNDHIFHNACLAHILDYVKRNRARNGQIPLSRAIVWTDNCGGQYKCCHNFWKIANAETIHGISIDQISGLRKSTISRVAGMQQGR
jgi:hypothetical protein